VVEITLRACDLAFVLGSLPPVGSCLRAPTGRRAASIAADPHVALVIDRDPVVVERPVVTLAGSAPMPDQIAILVELENGWRRSAALCSGRVGGGVYFSRFERAGSMDDPDVILRIDRYANGLAEDPVVRQRLRPQRVDFKPRRHDTGG